MTDTRTSPESPCIDICAINTDKVCFGCYRSLDEIAAWGRCNDQQKLAILDAANQRRETTK